MSKIFSWVYCRKPSKGRFPLPLSTVPKILYQVEQSRKDNWATLRLLECVVKQWRASQGTLGCRYMVWPTSSFNVEQVFSLVFALCDNLWPSSTGKCFKCVFPIDLYHNLVVHVTFELLEKCFNGVFWVTLSRKHNLLVGFFVSSSVFLYSTPNSSLLELCCSHMANAKQRLALFGVWNDKVSIFS